MSMCERCPYYWREPGEAWPRCQYDGLNDWAPCMQDDPDEPDEEEQ